MTEHRDLWWTLRKTSAPVYLEWGHAHATLHATELKMRMGPPVTIVLSLEHNLRKRSKEGGTYLDAKALADGGIRELRLVQLNDERALLRLRQHLEHTDDTSAPWRLLVMLGREHEFTVEPDFRSIGALNELLLRVVSTGGGSDGPTR